MDLKKRTIAFSKLGIILRQINHNELKGDFPKGIRQKHKQLQQLIQQQHLYNGWFTPENVNQAVNAIGEMLQEDKLTTWLEKYDRDSLDAQKDKKVGAIMAGNLPLVGFHDFLCVLISGNKIIAKLSSDDNKLLPLIAELLILIEPEFSNKIHFQTNQLKHVDAYITTGSNNTSRYFEYYFSEYPHIIRKNRNSLAILTGEESNIDLKNLAKDIFQYFGLGCRNVTKLLVPEKYDFNPLFEAFETYKHLINHNKYANNYEYNKSIYLVNKDLHLDNGFILLKQSNQISSPVACLYYDYYSKPSEVEAYLITNQNNLQCAVSKSNKHIPFGKTQLPELWDYADGVDTIDFLMGI